MKLCTTIDLPTYARGRVLLDSVERLGLSGSVTVLALDDLEAHLDCGEHAVVGPDDLSLDRDAFVAMAATFDAADLRQALIPWILEHQLADGTGPALWLAPETVLNTRMMPEIKTFTITARSPGPLPADGLLPEDTELFAARRISRSAVGAANDDTSADALDWWKERVVEGAAWDDHRGAFAAHDWLELVPTTLRCEVRIDGGVMLEPSFAIGAVDEADRVITVAGRVPFALDMSSLDPTRTLLVDPALGARARVLRSEHPALDRLARWYFDRLDAHAGLSSTTSYRTVPGAGALDARLRRLIAQERAWIRQGLVTDSVPDPYRRPEEFSAWTHGPGTQPGAIPGIGRYLAQVYLERPDLREAFPEVHQGEAGRLLTWAASHGVREGIPAWVVDTAPAPQVVASETAVLVEADANSVEVAGYLTAELGIGEASRLLVRGVAEAGIAVATTDYGNTRSRRSAAIPAHRSPAGRPPLAIVCLNPDVLPGFAASVGPGWFAGRRTVGLWFWESPVVPAWMRGSFSLVDEVWVASEFVAAAFRGITDRPVRVVPLPVVAPGRDRPAQLPELAGASAPTFLFIFDYLSVFERKNPVSVIDAFTSAFPEAGEARLVIKSVNGHLDRMGRERLRLAAARRDDVILIERYLARSELDGLFHEADAYVSLHRSEGFGLTMAEAMAAGLPVIATGWSGNLQFMDETTAFLVDYELVDVQAGVDPYEPGSVWAEPSVAHAASCMRSIAAEPEAAAEVATRGCTHVQTAHAPRALGAFVEERLSEAASPPARSWIRRSRRR